MPSRAGVEGTPIPQGILDSTMAPTTVRSFGDRFRDAWNAWFSPGPPLLDAIPPDAGYPRRFEYPVGFNMFRNPSRDLGSPSFAELRQLANLNTYVRLAIETCKDEISKVAFTFRPKRAMGESLASVAKRKNDPRIAELNSFFEAPGRAIHYPEQGKPIVIDCAWEDWLREFLEDLFVIDAPTISVTRNLSGAPYSLDVIDGSTIKPILNQYGQITSYQQWLYGVPGDLLGPDKIIYRPRNVRTSKIYGFSQVEQILVIVNIVLRRLSMQLAHYTEGNIPEAIIKAPEGWAPDQIEKFQVGWDAYKAGSAAARAKLTWVPGGTGDPKLTKVDSLKTEEDEWWVRVCMYAFSLSPQWASKMMNRATAETAQEQAKEQGLQPICRYVASSLTQVVRRVWGYDDIEAASEFEQDVDAEAQANVDKTYVSIGALSLNEVREKAGKEPIAGGDQHLIYTPAGAVPIPGTPEANAAQEQAMELAAARAPKQIGDGSAPAEGDGKAPTAAKKRHYAADNPHVWRNSKRG